MLNCTSKTNIFGIIHKHTTMAKDPQPDAVPRQRMDERPASLSKPLPREKLPKDLQKIVDKEDDVWDEIYDGQYALHLRKG